MSMQTMNGGCRHLVVANGIRDDIERMKMVAKCRGHSVSCMTILFLNLQITRSAIRPHIKQADSLVIANGHFNLPQGFVWVCMG